ncbi:MAG: NHL repeat-containing protein, partial [Chthoniobacterales bacterium]
MTLKFALKISAFLVLGLTTARADSFFVTNFGTNTITKYDENGRGALFTDAFVKGPTGIALDASGRVYVATRANTIERFAPDGTALGVFASTGLSNSKGLAFDRQGFLYAANFAANTIEKFAPDGTDLGIFANVLQPTGLAFDAAGNLHVASSANLIRRFAPDGAELSSFTSPTLKDPQGLAFDSLGKLHVANRASGFIQVFSPGGADFGPGSQNFQNPAPADSVGAQNIYIAFRSDGNAGDGSLRNPFDGSTQPKLDAIFKSFYDAGATNLIFHLGPGTFQMKGAWDFDWAMLTGWHIKGAGRSLTTVRQVVGARGVEPGSNGALFSNGAALTFDNQSVEDLTLDCAWFRSGPGGDNSRPHGNFQGINLYGANPTIRNVTVTGCGWQDNECFAILTSGGINDRNLPDNALYENVEVSGGATGPFAAHLTGMAMINLAAQGNDPTPVYAKNGRIINCTFDLPDAGNAGGMPAGYESGIVTGCTFIAYYHGIFHDTFVSRNITVVGNFIQALFPDGNGILFNSGIANTPCENISIVGNTVSSAGGIGFASAVRDFTILGNRILLAAGTRPDYCIFLDTPTVQNISVLQNSIDPGIPFLSRNTSGCRFAINRTPAGQNAIPDSMDTTAGLTTETNYAVVAALESAGLAGPTGLAFDGAGALHVVNALSATIGKFSADGAAGVFATTGFNPAFIAVQQTPRLANISTRLKVLTGDNVLAGGFILNGVGSKEVLIRGLGPSLAGAGVRGGLADPAIELYNNSTNTLVATNHHWRDRQAAEIEATGLAPASDDEAAIRATLSAGAYSV